MRITHASQIRHGLRVHGTLSTGAQVVGGRLWIEGLFVYICADGLTGAAPRSGDRFGKNGSWFSNPSEIVSLHDLHTGDDSRTILRERVRLIRAVMSAKDIAVKNGDGAAIDAIMAALRADAAEHFVSYSRDNPSMISYAAKPEYRVDSDHRVKTTLSRYVRQRLKVPKDALSDHGLKAINDSAFGALIAEDSDSIKVVSGDKIIEAYAKSVGGGSCMTGPDESDLLELYRANENIQMAILNKTEARALLWTTDCGKMVLDRVYPNYSAHSATLREWAKEKGYVTRIRDGAPDSSDRVSLSDGQIYTVTVRYRERMKWPYLDTFHYGRIDDDKAVLSNDMEDMEYCFSSTGGGKTEIEGGETCESCGCRIGRNDTHHAGDYAYCESCYDDHFSTCDRCEETTSNEDLSGVDDDYWCERCRDRHAHHCDRCGSWSADQTTTVEGDEWCEDCVADYATKCEGCDEYIQNSNINRTEDQHDACDDCCSECSDCGLVYLNDDLTDGVCDECREKREEENAKDQEDEETVQPDDSGDAVYGVGIEAVR